MDGEGIASNDAASDSQHEITQAVVETGLVCLGEPAAVDAYVARIQAVATRPLEDLGITATSLGDLGAAASTLAELRASSGQYFEMAPESLEKFRDSNVIPKAGGYFKG